MGINFEKLLSKETKYNVDKELLEEIEYNEVLFIISKEVLNYRDKNNLKQEDLAKKLNITQVMVSKIESGRYNFTIRFLVNLWNKLSDDKCNFGEILLRRIYEKIIKNYTNVYVEFKAENSIEKFNFKKDDIKKELVIKTEEYNNKINDNNKLLELAS